MATIVHILDEAIESYRQIEPIHKYKVDRALKSLTNNPLPDDVEFVFESKGVATYRVISGPHALYYYLEAGNIYVYYFKKIY